MCQDEKIKLLENKFSEQFKARRQRVLEAMTKDERSTISINDLAKALGIPPQQLQNAAWCHQLPFGYGHHGENAKSRYTCILKDTFWSWFNNATGFDINKMFMG